MGSNDRGVWTLRRQSNAGADCRGDCRLRHGVKLIVWDGTGLCLFAKRLEQGTFRWPKIEKTRCA